MNEKSIRERGTGWIEYQLKSEVRSEGDTWKELETRSGWS